jgi:branched-chain amino acid transport system substrate-binding protein
MPDRRLSVMNPTTKGGTMQRAARVLALLAAATMLAVLAAGCGGGDDDGGGEAAPETTAPAETAAPAETGAPADTGAAAAEAIDCTASIGIMAPITGDAASIGQEQLNWAKFAVDRFNEEHGTTFTLVEGDTQLDPAQAATVAPQFVSNDDIVAVVGPAGSQEIEAVGDIFEEAGMGFVSMSATATSLTEGEYPTFFRVVPTDADQAPTDANYMIEQLGVQKAFVIDDQTSYSSPLADGVQEVLEGAGVEVTRDSVSQDQTDFSALVSRVADDTDVVFLPWQIAANAQLFGQQMAEQGKTAIIFGSDGLFSPDDFSIAGSYVSSFAPDITSIPEDAELVEAYTAEYGEFGTFGPPTFAAATVAMDAIARVCEAGEEPSREAVLEQIAATNQETSILGQPIVFTANGDLEGAVFFIFQVGDDGAYTLVE